jgi:hypothetical protein
MTSVTFRGWSALVAQNRYQNGRVRLDLQDPETGEPLATASVNLPEVKLAEDEVAIKCHSENAGILETLTAAGVVEPPKRWVESAHVKIPVCKLVQR